LEGNSSTKQTGKKKKKKKKKNTPPCTPLSPNDQSLTTRAGHSLGAAQATLTALVLAVELGLETTVFNFGSPRIGNARFYEYLMSLPRHRLAVWRAVNERDIVPHLPPLDIGYHHVSTEMWRENATTWHAPGTASECRGGEDPTCSNSLGVSIELFEGIRAHESYFGVPTCDCSKWPQGVGPVEQHEP
jgi:hypothetical protein